jgi:hypothetical protein
MTKPIAFVTSKRSQKNQSLSPHTTRLEPLLSKKTNNNDYEADNESSQSDNESSQSDNESSQSVKFSINNDTQLQKRTYLEYSIADEEDAIIKEISLGFKNSLNVLRTISELTAGSEEETTEQESSHANHKKFVRFLDPIDRDKVAYKIYIKGLSSQSGTRYGVSIKKLDSASKQRKQWTGLMKKSDKEILFPQKKDKYYIHHAEVTGHYSHALPNCFYGTETPANAAYATRANFSSSFTGQGDAQGIIEEALRKIYLKKVDADKNIKIPNQKTPDLRWKSSDAFSNDGQLIYRRIKIYASDTYSSIKKENSDKYNYAEIILGEFFLPGYLAVSKNSCLIKELETKVSSMENNFNNLLSVYQENILGKRDTTFWKKNGFLSRDIEFDGVKKHRSHHIDVSESFPKEYQDILTKLNPVELQDEIADMAKTQKPKQQDAFLAPHIIQMAETETLDDMIDKICNQFKETKIDTLETLRTKHKEFFEELETLNYSEAESLDIHDSKITIKTDKNTLRNCHTLFSDLISEKLVQNNEIKLLANKMMLPNKGNSLYVNHTPITGWIFAILRIAKKIK